MVVLTMCGCAVLCWWLCGAAWYYMHACVIVRVGGCCVLCPCACMWSVCAWGMCVTVWVWGWGLCVYACVSVCVCICVWSVWRDGVWVCGSGCVVMAWGWWLWRGHVCVCVCVVVVVCLLVRVLLFVCVRCGVVWCVLRCCVDVVGGGLCGCTCIVWADGD